MAGDFFLVLNGAYLINPLDSATNTTMGKSKELSKQKAKSPAAVKKMVMGQQRNTKKKSAMNWKLFEDR